jgi:hypothetical protein
LTLANYYLSFDTTFDPCYLSLDSPLKGKPYQGLSFTLEHTVRRVAEAAEPGPTRREQDAVRLQVSELKIDLGILILTLLKESYSHEGQGQILSWSLPTKLGKLWSLSR